MPRVASIFPLQWRHNERYGVSNHQSRHCLLNRLFRRRSKKTSKLRVTGHLCGEFTGPGWIPRTKASNAENFPIDDVIMTSSCRGRYNTDNRPKSKSTRSRFARASTIVDQPFRNVFDCRLLWIFPGGSIKYEDRDKRVLNSAHRQHEIMVNTKQEDDMGVAFTTVMPNDIYTRVAFNWSANIHYSCAKGCQNSGLLSIWCHAVTKINVDLKRFGHKQ